MGDLGVGKRVKTMARALYGRINAYDQGLREPPPILEDALRRNLWRGAAVTDNHVAAMAAYMRREAASLAGQDSARLMAGTVTFGDPGA